MERPLMRIPTRSQRQAMDWSLVLVSQGIESTIDHSEDGDGGFGLYGLAFPRKEPESLSKVASSLNGLLNIVESADVAPSADAVTAHEKWDKAAEKALARWADFQNKDLANANAVLQKANLKPVATTETSAGR